MTTAYLGVDLTSRAERPSAYAVLTDDGELTLGLFGDDRELLDLVKVHRPWAIAIDAPLGLPVGWRCLESPCGCGLCIEPSADLRRSCELELVRRGIPCFWTTRRSIIKAMVYRGITLRESLVAGDAQVLEVFPYAVKRMLWGKAIPKKSTPNGLAYLQQGLLRLFSALPDEPMLTHDLADAALAAYTARLHHLGQTETLGVLEEGQIVVPRVLSSWSYRDDPSPCPSPTRSEGTDSDGSGCPP